MALRILHTGVNARLLSVALAAACLLPASADAQRRRQAVKQAPTDTSGAVVLKHSAPDVAERGRELVLRTVVQARPMPYLPTLYYRLQGQTRFYSLPLHPVPGSVNLWAASIPGIFVTEDIEYFLESYDTQLRGPGRVGSQEKPVRIKVIDPVVPPSQVTVRSDPPDAALQIGERQVGTTPWRGPLAPGTHEVLVSKKGYLDAASTLDVAPGRDIDLRLSLLPAAESAQFAVMSEPAGAKVFIDGQPLGLTPLVALSPEGKYRLVIEKPGYATAQRSILFSRDRSVEISFVMEKLPPEPALAVTTDPSGASVRLNGEVLGVTPFIGVIPSGEHSLMLELDGHRTAEAQILMPEDRDLDLRFALEEAKGAREPLLSVASDPAGATVRIDGEEVGVTPYLAIHEPGEHRVRLDFPGFVPYERRVIVPDAHDLEVSLALIPEPLPPGPAKVAVVTEPPGAAISVNGEPAGQSPVNVQLDAGAHVVVATREGFRTLEDRFSVSQGESMQMRLQLTPLPADGPLEPLLSVVTEPEGAVVAVNGKPVGQTPVSLNLAPGAHQMVVALEGYQMREELFEMPEDRAFELRYSLNLKPLRRTVTLASAAEQQREQKARASAPIVEPETIKSAGAPPPVPAVSEVPLSPLLTQPESPWRTGPLVLGGLGLAAFGGSAAFALRAMSTGTLISEPDVVNRTELRARQGEEIGISLGLAGAGIGLTAAGLIWAATTDSGKDKPKVSVSPGAGGGVVGVSGSF